MTLHVAAPPAERAAPPPPARGRRLLSWLDLRASGYVLVAPYFLLFAIFGVFPLVYTAWVSLHDWELAGDKTFLGLENYGYLISDPVFWNAVLNTIGIFALSTVPQLVLALMLANALNKRLRARLFLRLSILLPMVTSVVAVAVVFSQLYQRDYGLINWFLGLFGVDNIHWQGEKWSSWIAIASMVDWRWTGYNAIIYLAAMQTIPRDVYEAAELDGASPRRQFWQITVPMLRPTIIFTVFVSTIGGFTLFAEPMIFDGGLADGGTDGQFQTVAMLIYKEAFREFDYGYGAAAAWLLFALILIGALVNYSLARRIGGGK
ncbi:carbohydrate ABC transporter permease [Bailinhaonella thermotolerans]|uniref:Sugar ABC transporter permease n=1 Tax=Bailinhaonella thermotolerans TaxID=1070861 RepID=A0A3A4B0L7_9ACTN|nr:sugar ABC transporter permease [Bailinhaonella thermotolerans]RJL31643.1 sugar ABC transporter permease [Bailinhaonella thermotolerans]